jgi:hypothetical protein
MGLFSRGEAIAARFVSSRLTPFSELLELNSAELFRQFTPSTNHQAAESPLRFGVIGRRNVPFYK